MTTSFALCSGNYPTPPANLIRRPILEGVNKHGFLASAILSAADHSAVSRRISALANRASGAYVSHDFPLCSSRSKSRCGKAVSKTKPFLLLPWASTPEDETSEGSGLVGLPTNEGANSLGSSVMNNLPQPWLKHPEPVDGLKAFQCHLQCRIPETTSNCHCPHSWPFPLLLPDF